jgi:hypothetical protein
MRLIAPPERATFTAVSIDGLVPTHSSQFQDAFDALLAARGDDIRRAELAAQVGALLVPAHKDDLFRAEPRRGQHAAQSDRAVTDDGHSLAGAYPGGDRAVVARAVDVGQRQQ